MPVVASSFVFDAHTQPDGSRVCRETYTISDGRTSHRVYKLPAGQGETEAQARLDANVALMDESLAQREAESLLGGA